MLHQLILSLGIFCLGMMVGIAIVRYGLGLGSKLHVRAKNDMSIDENISQIDQEFSH